MISCIGTLTGVVSLFITFITWNNTKDIKKIIYKKNVKTKFMPELKAAINNINGRINYLNKDKAIEQFEFIKELSQIINILNCLSDFFNWQQKAEFKSIRNKFKKIKTQELLEEKFQLDYLNCMLQFCDKIYLYFKGE